MQDAQKKAEAAAHFKFGFQKSNSHLGHVRRFFRFDLDGFMRKEAAKSWTSIS